MVDFQDAIRTVRELTETICRMLQDPDVGDGVIDMGIAAVEAGNRFLRDAGHEPVDEANLPSRDEEDQEQPTDDC